MSKQVNFYIAPEELPDIERVLRGVEDFIVIACQSDTPQPKILQGLSDPLETSLFLCLVRPQDLKAVQVREVRERHLWSVDEVRSPVIEFTKCHRDEAFLGRGRMYAQTSYFDAQEHLCRKDPDFLAWLDKLLRKLKRQLKKEESSFFYLSAGARELQASGVTLRRL